MTAVSVIIPAYNSDLYLKETIESVLSQTFTDYEILVINDGSTDRTAEVARSFGDRIRYFEQKNGGPSKARNTGLKYAQGKYIAFLDADDLFLPQKLEHQVSFLETHPEVGLVYSDGLRFKIDKHGRETAIRMSITKDIDNTLTKQEDYLHALITNNVFPLHAGLVRKTCLDEVGGFDENLTTCEDWDLWYRVACHFQFSYLEAINHKYRVTPNSNSTDIPRNCRGMGKVMGKITDSVPFSLAPSNILELFFYRRGVYALGIGNSKMAIEYFKKSLTYNPWALNTNIALFLTTIFGQNSFKLFLIKRKLLGINGIKQIK